MLVDYMYHPVDFMQYSKTYYHWLVAERDLQKQISPSKAKSIEQLYGQMIQPSALRSLEQHRETSSLKSILPNHWLKTISTMKSKLTNSR